MRHKIERYLKSGTQRILFAFEMFSKNEMANHAAAGSYSFLLSAIPAILVIAYILSKILHGIDLDSLIAPYEESISSFLSGISSIDYVKSLVTRPLSLFTGAFGIINLIWAGRLFTASLQRGVRVIYSDTAKANPVRENILTFLLELVIIFAVVLIITAATVFKAALSAIEWEPALNFITKTINRFATWTPTIVLWLFIFLTFKNVPPVKPKWKHAFITSVLCIASNWIVSFFLGLTMNLERYGLVYGILGNLIVLLIKVYFFFMLYYFFAELCFTLEYFDTLLFSRMYRISTSPKSPNKIDKILFREPSRLFRKYAKNYRMGDIIFNKGDLDESVYYLYRGSIGIFIVEPEDNYQVPISVVTENEFFGEMSYILKEPRSAWAEALTDCTVFELPPALFEQLLLQDANTSRHLVEMIAARLRANNTILAGEELK